MNELVYNAPNIPLNYSPTDRCSYHRLMLLHAHCSLVSISVRVNTAKTKRADSASELR
jgi:hypothetical protein